MGMNVNALAFALGVGLLQWQPSLPGFSLAPLLGLGALAWVGLGWLPLAPSREGWRRLALLALACAFGFGWAGWRAQLRMADQLAPDLEGRDLRLTGVVAALPQATPRGWRFEFQPDSLGHPVGAGAAPRALPSRLLLSWYKDKEGALPALAPGQRWRLTLRLKRPHGNVNGAGFDYEAWLLERGLGAVGYVRGEEQRQLLAESVIRAGVWPPGLAVERLRCRLREHFQAALPAAEYPYQGVLLALAIGDQQAIPGDQWRVFSRTGITHLISISGLHVTLVGALAGAWAGWLWRRRPGLLEYLPVQRLRIGVAWAAAGAYTLLAGAAVPALRTWAMLSAVALALTLGRGTKPGGILGFALWAVLLWDPWAVLAPGFWLSFLAVAALLVVGSQGGREGGERGAAEGEEDEGSSQDSHTEGSGGPGGGAREAPVAPMPPTAEHSPWGDIPFPPAASDAAPEANPGAETGQSLPLSAAWANAWRDSLPRLRPPALGRVLAEWGRTQGAVTLLSLPLVLLFFQQFSLISPLANGVAIPLVSLVITPLVLAGALLPFFPWLLQAAHGLFAGLMAWLGWLAAWPRAVWSPPAPDGGALVLAGVGVVWMLMPRGFPGRVAAGLLLLPLLVNPPPRPPPGEAWVEVLDVGQGLAVAVRTAEHTLLYDTGPYFSQESDAGQRLVVPWLRAMGVTRLDGLVITHRDLDHAGGAVSVLESLPVGWLLDSLPEDSQEGRAIHPRVARRAPCLAGAAWVWEGVAFRMLYPDARDDPRLVKKSNHRSCVLQVRAAGHTLLLTSDIEGADEAALLARYPGALGAEVLVVPHHGSKTSSSPAFVAAVGAREVIYPVGYRNRFGHPRPEILARYQGARAWRTDRDGAVSLHLGPQLALSGARATWPRYWRKVMLD